MKNLKKALYCFVISLFVFGCNSVTSEMSKEVGKKTFKGLDDRVMICAIDDEDEKSLRCGTKDADFVCSEDTKVKDCVAEHKGRVLQSGNTSNSTPGDYLKGQIEYMTRLPLKKIQNLPENYYWCEKIKLLSLKGANETFVCYLPVPEKNYKTISDMMCDDEFLKEVNMNKETCEKKLGKIFPVNEFEGTVGNFIYTIEQLEEELSGDINTK